MVRQARTDNFDHTISGLISKRADLFNEAKRINYHADIEGDVYSIDTLPFLPDPYSRRDCVKELLLIMLNARTEKSALKAFRRKSDRFRHLSPRQLRKVAERIKDKHKAIADYFGSDCGVDLQHSDSMIAELIVSHFTRRRVPVLTIHDSFIVGWTYQAELEEIMRRAFKEMTGVESPVLKVVTSEREEHAEEAQQTLH